MILQALHSYYQRLAEQEDSDAAPEGFAPQGVHFALSLSPQGELLEITDLRTPAPKGNKQVARQMILPSLGKGRTVGIEPNFLWDGPGYVLGRDDKGKPERTAKCRDAFRHLHEELLDGLDIPEALALLRFLASPPADHPKVEERWEELSTANLVFKVGEAYLHDLSALKAIWSERMRGNESDEGDGICLVTGKKAPIAELHAPIKGVSGAQSSGAALCSYNLQAFESFGKKQNLNGPVSRNAAFGYATALNYLIKRPSQSLRLGAATVVCWAERETPLEDNLFALFSGSQPESKLEADMASAAERAGLLRRLERGLPVTEAWPELDPGVNMHVLALMPNAARLAVSFYLHGPAEKFLEHIRQYYGNLAIARRFEGDPEFPSVWQIARAALGPHKKTDDFPSLGKDILWAGLHGHPYPSCLLPMVLQRLRSGDQHSSVRIGLIKAMLIRNYQLNPQKEASMSLNPDHSSPAYQLGRLFALLVGVQRKAIGQQINADIRDKYYGSASATPALVFPLLLRNAQNHISKAQAHGYDKLIRDVLEHINDKFPAHFDLKDQGLFALGYYHQRAEKAVKQDEDNNHANPEEA